MPPPKLEKKLDEKQWKKLDEKTSKLAKIIRKGKLSHK